MQTFSNNIFHFPSTLVHFFNFSIQWCCNKKQQHMWRICNFCKSSHQNTSTAFLHSRDVVFANVLRSVNFYALQKKLCPVMFLLLFLLDHTFLPQKAACLVSCPTKISKLFWNGFPLIFCSSKCIFKWAWPSTFIIQGHFFRADLLE